MPFLLALLTLAVVQASTASPSTGMQGTWREPAGSLIRVAPCGPALCLTLVDISSTAPARTDHHNPNTALRTRTLCGVQIGTGFHATDATHADGGTLYDPKTGKTYHGLMSSSGDVLSLRGYIGAKAFGRTEKWTRTADVTLCTK